MYENGIREILCIGRHDIYFLFMQYFSAIAVTNVQHCEQKNFVLQYCASVFIGFKLLPPTHAPTTPGILRHIHCRSAALSSELPC